MYKRVNEYYDYKYNDALISGIKRSEFNILIANGNIKEAKKGYPDFYKKYKIQKRYIFIRNKFAVLWKILGK